MKKNIIMLLSLASLNSIAAAVTMDPRDTTTVLNVDGKIKVQVVRYEDNYNRCYVMVPTGSYTSGQVASNPIMATSGISCVPKQ